MKNVTNHFIIEIVEKKKYGKKANHTYIIPNLQSVLNWKKKKKNNHDDEPDFNIATTIRSSDKFANIILGSSGQVDKKDPSVLLKLFTYLKIANTSDKIEDLLGKAYDLLQYRHTYYGHAVSLQISESEYKKILRCVDDFMENFRDAILDESNYQINDEGGDSIKVKLKRLHEQYDSTWIAVDKVKTSAISNNQAEVEPIRSKILSEKLLTVSHILQKITNIESVLPNDLRNELISCVEELPEGAQFMEKHKIVDRIKADLQLKLDFPSTLSKDDIQIRLNRNSLSDSEIQNLPHNIILFSP